MTKEDILYKISKTKEHIFGAMIMFTVLFFYLLFNEIQENLLLFASMVVSGAESSYLTHIRLPYLRALLKEKGE